MLLKRWIPTAVLVVTLLSTVLIWRALVRSERTALTSHVASTASAAREFLRDELEYHAQAISRLGKRWDLSAGESAWSRDALILIESSPAFRAIVLTGPASDVLSSVPAEIPASVMSGEQAAKAFAAARLSGSPALSAPVKLEGGGMGFVIAVPLSDGREFGGIVAGLFEGREFVKSVLSDSRHELDGRIVSVSSGGVELYRNSAAQVGGWSQEVSLEGAGADWKITVWPVQEVIAEYITILPQTILALGSISSVLLSALIYLAQTNRLKTRNLEKANEMLKAEVRQRAGTEEELRRSDEKFRSLVETMSDWIWEVD